jgi:hypothetical protein
MLRSVKHSLSSFLLCEHAKVKIRLKMIILYVVLYGCEAMSLIQRVEHRLRVFENRVLRKIFVHDREELTRR